MTIKLDLIFGEPDLGDTSVVHVPVSPNQVNKYYAEGWSIFDLEKAAFDNLPREFEEARKLAGQRLTRLIGKDAVLKTYGPIEGNYYIELPGSLDEQA